jgi:hypothetical protein
MAGGMPMRTVVKLLRDGVALCEILVFQSAGPTSEVQFDDELESVPAICCFTVPIESRVDSHDPARYELAFSNGARFPIKIRQVLFRMGGPIPSGHDVVAELI